MDGKADFDNLPCTTREPDTVFFTYSARSRKDKEIKQNTDKMEMRGGDGLYSLQQEWSRISRNAEHTHSQHKALFHDMVLIFVQLLKMFVPQCPQSELQT